MGLIHHIKPTHWVKKASHLGNNLTVELTNNRLGMDNSSDLLQKRAIFFKKFHELKQAYGEYCPELVCEIIRIFGTAFYGSPLWSLNSEEHLKLLRSWNTMVKIVYDLPYETHKRFVESLTDFPHLQSMLHGRYVGFAESLKNSKKLEIKMLYNLCTSNILTNTGNNLNYLMNIYDVVSVEELFSEKHNIKEKRVYKLEQSEEWKPKMIRELTLVKRGLLDNRLEAKVNKALLRDICVN